MTLRWYHAGKRTLRSLGFMVRGPRGGLDREAIQRAVNAAEEQMRALASGRAAPVQSATPEKALTILEGWARAKHPDLGKWNKATSHRADIERAIKRAMAVWGPTLTWNEVDRGQLRKLWRKELARLRAAGHSGVRGAQLTLDLVLAVAAWLRDEQLIDSTAALRWKQLDHEFADDAGEHEPKRPRYTVEEYRKLFVTAWDADERYGLLYGLGAEYRLGQVASAMRSALNRELGRLRISGKGKKRGEVIHFTEQQKADVERVLTSGYLAGLETAYAAGTIADYPLFPGGHFARNPDGQLVSRAEYATRAPVDRTAWRAWHAKAEELADIPHVPGRGPYASRRAGVDGAKEAKISREALERWGGWSDQQMPDQVYADQQSETFRREAAEVRAKVRAGTPAIPQKSSQIVAPSDDVISSPITPEA